VVGKNSLVNVTVKMDSVNGNLSLVCSYGAKWSYSNSPSDLMATYENTVTIDSIMLQHVALPVCVKANSGRSILELDLNDYSVHVDIKNSNFSNLNGRILNVHMSSTPHSHVNIYKCFFIQNSV